jgi:hypothetical protein
VYGEYDRERERVSTKRVVVVSLVLSESRTATCDVGVSSYTAAAGTPRERKKVRDTRHLEVQVSDLRRRWLGILGETTILHFLARNHSPATSRLFYSMCVLHKGTSMGQCQLFSTEPFSSHSQAACLFYSMCVLHKGTSVGQCHKKIV